MTPVSAISPHDEHKPVDRVADNEALDEATKNELRDALRRSSSVRAQSPV